MTEILLLAACQSAIQPLISLHQIKFHWTSGKHTIESSASQLDCLLSLLPMWGNPYKFTFIKTPCSETPVSGALKPGGHPGGGEAPRTAARCPGCPGCSRCPTCSRCSRSPERHLLKTHMFYKYVHISSSKRSPDMILNAFDVKFDGKQK